MVKRYAWPGCTVPGCGHERTHKTEAQAQKIAKQYQRRYTTKEGNAVCKCHDGLLPFWEFYPRDRFRCDQFRTLEAEAYDAAVPLAEYDAAISVGQPLDPRDVAPW